MRVFALTCVAMLTPGLATAQEWIRFRGPNGTGVSEATTVPARWTDRDFNWKVSLPGVGQGSPVVWGEKIFLTSGDEASAERMLLCVDASDGRILWKQTFASEPHRHHRKNTYASGTPAVDERHVYFTWGTPDHYWLMALDHDGRLVWRRDLGPFAGNHGAASSPIVVDDAVVLGNDQEGESFLIAVDRMTGRTVWKIDRDSTRATYSTPCVYERSDGRKELIFTDWYHGITSVDPTSGRLNWEVEVFGRDDVKRAIGSPIVAGDLVIGTCGFVTGKKFLVAVRPPPAGSDEAPRVVYRIDRGVPHVPTPLAYRGLIFLWGDKGIVTCVSERTGEVVWTHRVRGRFFGSPVCVGGRLFCVSEEGEVVVLEASHEFALLARNPLDDVCRSTPAVADGVMYIRTQSKLFAIGGKLESGK